MDFFYLPELIVLPEQEDIPLLFPVETDQPRLVVLLEASENKEQLVSLLMKILEAGGFNPRIDSTICILDPQKPITLKMINDRFHAPHILSFGLHENCLKTQFNKLKYLWLRFTGFSIVFSDELSIIHSDERLKMQLWTALKSEFLSNE